MPLSRVSWLSRLAWVYSFAALAGSGALLVASWLEAEQAIQPLNIAAVCEPDAALGACLVSLALIAYQAGRPRGRWLAAAGGLVGLAGLLHHATGATWPLFFNELFVRESPVNAARQQLAMHPVLATCLILVGISFPLLGARRIAPRSALIVALTGSLLMSVGSATLVGYGFSLPSVYRWGGDTGLAIGAAALIAALGIACICIAWQEQQGEEPGAPSWIPFPAIIFSATITFILWTALREAELNHLGAATQAALRGYASEIARNVDRESDTVDRFARHLSSLSPDAAAASWSAEAKTVRNEIAGCIAVTELDSAGRVLRSYPTEAGPAPGLDQTSDVARAVALQQVREQHRVSASGSVHQAADGKGFAIYGAIVRNAQLTGFVGAEVSYRRFFASLDRTLNLAGNYHIGVYVADEVVHQSGLPETEGAETRMAEVFDVADRRIRLEFSPAPAFAARTRRYLPELALGAGFGITLLLGLSVHLARTARSRQRAAEESNRQLLAENEERRRVEEALRRSQATTRKLSFVASKTDNVVIIAGPDGKIEWVNESFERVFEYKLNEVTGRHPADFLIGPSTSRWTMRRVEVAMRRGKALSTDVVNYSKSGKKYHLHLEIQPVHNHAGVLENFIAIQADITARVETENYLRRAKAEADAASRAKSDFLASMSHEIRTPMNGVIGMTSLLLDTHLNHEQRDCVNTIRTSGDALLSVINDILDFSKIESGKMELENLPFELSICIEDALDLFSVQASTKKLELSYHIEPSVPAWVQGDITRLRQVLVNLVNNAVKFTPAGHIDVTVRTLTPFVPIDTKAPGPIELEFSVSDTGIGIPADRLDRLFQPFSQVDSSTTRKYGGTGLGLAISHRLCTLMHGAIKVQSTVGLGSTFAFTIRVEPVNTPPGWGLPELPVRLNYGEILCVEDHPVTQSRLQTFFTTWGARAVCAATPEAALEYLKGDVLPLAIILDHDLTDTETGRTLRDHVRESDIPTLVLLAPGQTVQQLEPFAGRRGVATATKPLRTHALIRGIQTLFDNPPDSLPPFVVADEMRLLAHDLPLDILVAEDNPVNQKVALRFLDRLGYRADAVANGIEAVNTLQSRHYHLVLMDLQMPEMDGFEATRQLRRRLAPDRQPKVIALTANALTGDREQCLAAGMDDYITKPVKLLDIAHAIRRQFSLGSRSPLRHYN